MDPKPKPTSKVPVKPATGKVPTTASTATKGNTSRVQKKATERVPTGTARATSRKKNNPLVLAGLGVLVLGIVVAVCLFIRDPREPWPIVLKRLQEREQTAAKAESEGLDRAILLWMEALKEADTCGYPDETATMRSGYKTRIEGLKGTKAEHAKLEEKWREVKTGYDKVVAKTADKRDWIAEARQYTESFQGMPWEKEYKEAKDRVAKLIEDEDNAKKALDFVNFRAATLLKHKYNEDLDGGWGPALDDFRAYVANKDVTADDKGKAQTEMKTIESRAKDGLARHKSRAERLDRAEAKKYLEARKPQFVGTAVQAEFEQLLKSYS
jgi:hypothetical protein